MSSQRALAAIVFTDAVGFSALAATDERRAFRLLEADFETMREIAGRFEGQSLKTLGDGMLLAFGSAVQALEWATEFQRIMRERAPDTDGPLFEHRIGIHVGDVLLSSDDAQGDGVNVASRLQSGAPPGGIWMSSTVHDLTRSRLNIQTVRRGAVELKNIPEAVEVFEVPPGPVQSGPGRRTPRAGIANPQRQTMGVLTFLTVAVVALAAAVIIILTRPGTAPGPVAERPDPTASELFRTMMPNVDRLIDEPGENDSGFRSESETENPPRPDAPSPAPNRDVALLIREAEASRARMAELEAQLREASKRAPAGSKIEPNSAGGTGATGKGLTAGGASGVGSGNVSAGSGADGKGVLTNGGTGTGGTGGVTSSGGNSNGPTSNRSGPAFRLPGRLASPPEPPIVMNDELFKISPAEEKRMADAIRRAFEAGETTREFGAKWREFGDIDRTSRLAAQFGRKSGDVDLAGFAPVKAKAKSDYRFLAIASWIEDNHSGDDPKIDLAAAYWVQLDGWFLSLKSSFLGTTKAKPWTLEHLGRKARAWAEFDRVVIEFDGKENGAKRWDELPPRVVGELGRAFVKERPTPERSLGWVMFMNEYGFPLAKRTTVRARTGSGSGDAGDALTPEDPE
ncbi:MAG: adenylate/guanylate cyclase domain-containing protein [Fimbriimonadaceae bacterium]|nr:adenylate/guanylate cyclase domain-containing protein [Fimbriimonadaceae bacterium]